MKTNKIGKKQRIILQHIADACTPRSFNVGEPLKVLPLYTSHLPDIFNNDGDMRRFIENLERRGLIRIEKRHFLYITAFGKSLLQSTTQSGS